MTGVIQLALFLLSLTAAASGAKGDNKRLVLQGEMDVEQKILSLEAKLNSQQATIHALTSHVNTLQGSMQVMSSKAGGSVYVRWGRTTCPGNSTELIYKGYMAGNYHSASGGGTNTQCLPDNPTWGNYVDGEQPSWRSYLHSVEVETGTPYDQPFGYKVQDEDLPCAVCRVPRVSSLMIPARVDCYPGWSMEYTGYLMSSWNGYDASDTLCVDSQPEFVNGGHANTDGHRIYPMETTCASLPCPPYVDGRELACVVCSK